MMNLNNFKKSLQVTFFTYQDFEFLVGPNCIAW